jgi:amino acid transporter
MLGLIDPERGTLRLYRLLILDVIAVSLLTAANVLGRVALYPLVAVGFFVLFVVNLLIVRRAFQQELQRPQRENRVRVPRLSWLAAVAFTPAGIAAIVACVLKPNLLSTIRAVVAVLLVGYIWFLIYRLTRRGASPPLGR